MRYSIGNETLNKVINKANELDLRVEMIEGSLLDNYLILNNGKISLGKSKKPYKYIVILEKYLNEWSSEMILITTNNKKDLGIFKDRIEEIEGEM